MKLGDVKNMYLKIPYSVVVNLYQVNNINAIKKIEEIASVDERQMSGPIACLLYFKYVFSSLQI